MNPNKSFEYRRENAGAFPASQLNRYAFSRMIMKSFKTYLKESEQAENLLLEQIQLFEHIVYKTIPGTRNSYREDPNNTNTRTIRHSHTYAEPNGRGRELYAVNIDGSGHDGSSGIEIPSAHADFFRGLGYNINQNNILESLDFNNISNLNYSLILIVEDN